MRPIITDDAAAGTDLIRQLLGVDDS